VQSAGTRTGTEPKDAEHTGRAAASHAGDARNADRFLEIIQQFEDFVDEITPERAHAEFDETTLQLFWMRWPEVSAWAGSLWRLLSEELSGPATPYKVTQVDEAEDTERRQPG
jgi:hypothetical protein